ncbi:MAG: hypothetical protein ABJ244_17220, partial [Marinobacter sp.]
FSVPFMLVAALGFAGNVAGEGSPGLTVLDGKAFLSNLGQEGQPADIEDLLVFEDGQFVSRECERYCGYVKADYWVRAHDDAVQMFAEVPCTLSDAVMRWKATIRGDEIEGTFLWINKRWYWTFEKQFWFKGHLVNAEAQ